MNAESAAGLLVVLSAPSGGGKTTVCRNLLAVGDSRLARAVTCTTRAPRPGERDGIDYHFLSAEGFERRWQEGEFLEAARVHGERYGTLRHEVAGRLIAGQDVLLNIDVQGAAAVREAAAGDELLKRALITVFLVPGSPQELEQRLRGRGTESEAALRGRLAAARGEVAHWREFDYLLVSGTMEEDVRRLQVILEAERLRTWRKAAPWATDGAEPTERK